MTNAEKFKEVFGTDLGPKPEEAPCIFDIRKCIPGNTCEGCPYEHFWVKEYEEVNNMTNGEKIKEIFDGMTDEQKKIVQAMIDESDEDNINPNHYKNTTSLECIEAMLIAFGSDMVIAFCLCNAWKYIWRWENKNGIEDLKKAEWYIEKGRDLLGEFGSTNASTNLDQRFDSMADYINSNLKEEK